MIDKKTAKQIAKDYVNSLEAEIGEPVMLNESKILEEEFGWIFFYDSKSYFESNSFRDRLMGNAPFIVDARNGLITVTGTAEPIEYYISKYKQGVCG